MNMKLFCATLVLLIAAAYSAEVTPESPGWFAFAIPGLDASPTATDLSWLNPAPAGADGFIRAAGGHFVDGKGKRVRFFGTNLTATACFPAKDDAPKVAAHLRK